jgi:integrase
MGLVTFEDGAKDILTDYKTNGKKSHDHVKRRIDLALEPFFRGKRLLSINTSLVREYVAARQDNGAANATINRELAALKRMFSLAVQAGKLHAKPHIPMLREDNTRRGFFEREQFEGVRSHLPAPLQAVATFAYVTRWRTDSEILPLEWRHVDWNGKVVRLDPGTTKNREGRSFPFTTALEALLKAQLAEHERLKKDADKIVALVFHRDGAAIKSFRPGVDNRLQGRRRTRASGARLSQNRRAEPRARGRASVGRDGHGRSQDRVDLPEVRDRRRRRAA